MPQFDISSFIVQLLSLFLVFLFFYFVFSWKYLSAWARLLKTRSKLTKLPKLKDLPLRKLKIFRKKN